MYHDAITIVTCLPTIIKALKSHYHLYPKSPFNRYSGMTASINIKGYYIEKLYQGPACSVSNHLCTVRWTESYPAHTPILMMLKTRKTVKE